jgi:hypothetical protein
MCPTRPWISRLENCFRISIFLLYKLFPDEKEAKPSGRYHRITKRVKRHNFILSYIYCGFRRSPGRPLSTQRTTSSPIINIIYYHFDSLTRLFFLLSFDCFCATLFLTLFMHIYSWCKHSSPGRSSNAQRSTMFTRKQKTQTQNVWNIQLEKSEYDFRKEPYYENIPQWVVTQSLVW